jgi:hypothetical protein
MAHNVPAVYDVLPARIRALRSKDQGWQNVGKGLRGNGAKRNDLANRNPRAAEWRRSIYSPVMRSAPYSTIFLNLYIPFDFYFFHHTKKPVRLEQIEGGS